MPKSTLDQKSMYGVLELSCTFSFAAKYRSMIRACQRCMLKSSAAKWNTPLGSVQVRGLVLMVLHGLKCLSFSECRHLLSRMLVTTPSNRATLAEVANHPWITKGYDGAPSSHMPFREPLRHGELDPTVIAGMTGFEFGTAAETEAKLNEVLTSDAYVNALSQWDETRNGRNAHGSLRSPDSPHDFDSLKVKSPNRRFSGFGFYGKKLAGNVAAAFGGSKTDENAGDPFGLGSKSQLLGAARKPDILDPTKAFHPLLSIYYLVKEKMDRDKIYGPGVFASSTLSLMGPPAPPPLSTLAGVHTNVDHGRLGLGKPVNVSLAAPPTAAIAGRGSMVQPAPTPSWPRPLANGAVSSNANYDEADESSMQRTNSQQRSRRSPTHAFSAPNTPAVLQGGFRRTAAPTEPTKPHTRPHSSTPASQHRHSMHIPPDSGNDGLGTSAPPSSTAYALPPQNEEQATASSQPPTLVKRFGSILGRSDDKDRKKSQRNSLSLSGSWMGLKDRSVSAGPPPATSTLQEPVPMSPDLDVSLAAPSAPATIVRSSTTGSTLFPTRGHARGMSVDTANQPGSTPAGRRQFSLGGSASMRRPKTAGGVSGEHVTEEDENEVQLQPDESDLQNAASTAAEVKPVYLKVGCICKHCFHSVLIGIYKGAIFRFDDFDKVSGSDSRIYCHCSRPPQRFSQEHKSWIRVCACPFNRPFVSCILTATRSVG